MRFNASVSRSTSRLRVRTSGSIGSPGGVQPRCHLRAPRGGTARPSCHACRPAPWRPRRTTNVAAVSARRTRSATLLPVRSPLLKKSLGQHHLVDPALCRPPGRVPAARQGERVLEIGPGGGVLTPRCSAAGARVLGWEVDPEWAAVLRQPPPRPAAWRLVVGRRPEIPWDRLPAPTLAAGNLPYNVATAILERPPPAPRPESRAPPSWSRRRSPTASSPAPATEAYGSLSA